MISEALKLVGNMKNIGLLLLCVVFLYGCKSRQSHVQKATLDSVVSNRESINLDVQATAYKAQHINQQFDSTWNNTLKLKNFKGIIFPDGRLQGEAESILSNQSGSKRQEENTSNESKDSTSNKSTANLVSNTNVEKRNNVAIKETQGIEFPWYIWFILVGAIAFLIYAVYNRIKKKLNPFIRK